MRAGSGAGVGQWGTSASLRMPSEEGVIPLSRAALVSTTVLRGTPMSQRESGADWVSPNPTSEAGAPLGRIKERMGGASTFEIVADG
jgi:hypothetical protein